MKFRTERDGLLEALATAGRAASTRGAGGPGATSLQLALHGNHLVVTGSDPDLVIEVRASVAGDSDGVVLVPSRLLVDIVRSFEPGAVTLTSDEDEVRITSGRAEFTVRIPVGAEISRLSAAEGEGITLPTTLFAEGLRQVVRAALADDTRAPQLTGVLMVATDAGLRLVATDSYRLAFRDLAGVSALAPGSEVLIPARALAEIQRLVGSGSDGAEGKAEPLVFHHGELDAVFDLGEVQLTTRLLRGPFPDYERLLPASYPNSFTTSRDDLASALRRVRLMVRDTKDATTPVRIAFGDGGAELTVLTAETGRAAERVEGAYSGDELVVAFNPTYLLDGIEAIRSDTIILDVIDSTKPATVRGAEEDDYRYLLMPVRVS
ncbi:MAG: Beta sliding clamp [Acidimicrobiaceae bacterium]|nr:Beta sliding clamp [Acidimicrobiaceae bacterium]